MEDCENCGASVRRLGVGRCGGGEATRGTLMGLALLPVGWSGRGLAHREDPAHPPARGTKFPGRSGVQARSSAAVGKKALEKRSPEQPPYINATEPAHGHVPTNTAQRSHEGKGPGATSKL